MINPNTISLYQPINQLKPVSNNIWIVDGPVVQMSIFAGISMPFPTRMTIIRLSNDDLWIHSPTPLTTNLKKEIDQLGKVKHLISPNKLHYTHIPHWAKAYPNAISWASWEVEKRAKQNHTSIKFDKKLRDTVPWQEEIKQHHVPGNFLEEVIFFHPLSKTLILTDLIENFELHKVSKWLHLPLKLAGNADPDGKMPLDLRLTFFGHKTQLNKALEQMLIWHPDRVIIAHGRWYDKNGVAELKRAFRWLN